MKNGGYKIASPTISVDITQPSFWGKQSFEKPTVRSNGKGPLW